MSSGFPIRYLLLFITTPIMLGNLNLKLFFRVSLLRIDADAQLASPVIWVVPARAYGKC